MATASIGTLLRHIHQLAARGSALQRTDRQLLDDFSARRDEAAFTAVVARHGPMVLRVCRRVLNHEQDAEDAFQATFLILARKTASIRNREALAEWLHGVAYRTALELRRRSARRRNHEERLWTLMSKAAVSPSWDDVQAVLDEEIQRLPESFRSAFVLCILEGKTGAEAAAELGIKPGTVSSRLTRARQRLQQRLVRRGIKLSALLAALAVAEGASGAAVPAVLTSATIHSGLLVAAGGTAAGIIPSHVAALAAGVARAMFLSKAKFAIAMLFAAGLFAAGASVAAHHALAAKETPPAAEKSEPAKEPTKAQAERAKPAPIAKDKDGDTVELTGRVLDPGGKPVAGAKLFLWGRSPLNGLKGNRNPTVRASAETGGLFRFRVSRSELTNPQRPDPWQDIQLVASAPGYGPNWVPLGQGNGNREITVKLVPDDVPIEGRVLTLEGRPLKSVTVSPYWLHATSGEDLTPFIKAVRAEDADAYVKFLQPKMIVWSATGQPPSFTTDAQGRFRITGVGRERMLILRIRGETIAYQAVHVMTRPGDPLEVKMANSTETYHGARFDHLAAPSQPIAGTVRDKETGKPVAGVTIQRGVSQATTDGAGRYRLLGIPKGLKGHPRRLTALPPADQPYFLSFVNVADRPGLAPVTVDFELRRGIWIEGKVTDQSTGKPVAQVAITYHPADVPENREFIGVTHGQVWTGNDGSYRVLGLPGPGEVIAVSYFDDRYLVASQRGDGPQDFERGLHHAFAGVKPAKGARSVKSDLTLEPGREVTGTVVGPKGEPLSGAQVSGLKLPRLMGWVTLEGAAFTVKALNPRRPPRTVLFYHAEQRLAGAVDLRGNEKTPVTVKLQPWGTVTGRLVDDAGQPCTKVVSSLTQLESWDKDENKSGLLSRGLPSIVKVERTGRFKLEGLVPGRKYFFGAAGANEMPVWRVNGLSTASAETKDVGDISPFKFRPD